MFLTPQQDLLYTIIGLVLCVGFGGLFYWLGTRPHNKLKPRLVPWRFMAFGLIAFGFALLVHLVNLMGFETGNGGFSRR